VAAARYLQIVADIGEQIRTGELREDDALPSLAELMATYRVTEVTAGKAIRALVAAGLVVSQRGVGVFVRRWRPIRRIVPARFTPSPVTMNERDSPGRAVEWTTAIAWATPPPEVAELLGGDDKALSRRRIFHVDARAVQIGTSWIPADVAPAALEQVDVGPGGMWARLAEAGHGPTGQAWERWRVRPATPAELDLLELPPGSRVLEGFRAVRDAGGRVVDVTALVLAESAYELEFRFDL
jgi:GntR family transcriptional regulator